MSALNSDNAAKSISYFNISRRFLSRDQYSLTRIFYSLFYDTTLDEFLIFLGCRIPLIVSFHISRTKKRFISSAKSSESRMIQKQKSLSIMSWSCSYKHVVEAGESDAKIIKLFRKYTDKETHTYTHKRDFYTIVFHSARVVLSTTRSIRAIHC